ncbi:MAG TPA: ABC transporter permease [Spongiibacteraceae bacterium]|nr:ABC transporter permease [Spongiibacteraceae bacterium]
MSLQTEWVAFSTIARKEARRFLRIWSQTLLPPAISMSLYFIIFGSLIGSRIGTMGGYSYMQFMVPGLIMMAVLTNAYSNVVSSFFGAKFQRHIEELLVSPTSNHTILLGFVLGGVMRGICVGAIVTVLSLFFSKLHIQHVGITILILLLTSLLFSLLGFINAVYANNFDDISIVPTFVLTPLTYLGGVFYSIDLLPAFWSGLSRLNPILYIVNGFRYGFLGVSDVNVDVSFAIVLAFTVAAYTYSMHLLRSGKRLRT